MAYFYAKGGRVANLDLSASPATGYSDTFQIPLGTTWSAHLETTETTATFAVTPTLWASNKPNPSETNDADWVEMTSDHGWDDFPGVAVTGSTKRFADVGNSGAYRYRFKFARTGGAGNVKVWVALKDNK
jgi:hypothetical protein